MLEGGRKLRRPTPKSTRHPDRSGNHSDTSAKEEAGFVTSRTQPAAMSGLTSGLYPGMMAQMSLVWVLLLAAIAVAAAAFASRLVSHGRKAGTSTEVGRMRTAAREEAEKIRRTAELEAREAALKVRAQA